MSDQNSETPGRRTFLKTGSLAAAATLIPTVARAEEAASEIKVALVGCGGRGTGAASQSLSPGTKIVAMADAFEDNVNKSYETLKKQFGDRIDVPAERRFHGFDAYQKAIDSADLVLLCTPPGFRPSHFEYAVEKGKHVFMEKPVAVDGPGYARSSRLPRRRMRKNSKSFAVSSAIIRTATWRPWSRSSRDSSVKFQACRSIGPAAASGHVRARKA